MAGTIKDYRKMVDEPWGRMFYDLIYRQLDISDEKKLNILDFGAGFCLTAAHYAAKHNVTAVEPNEEMYELRVTGNYTLITKGIEYLKSVEDNTFDIVICHNVLEYTDDKAAILNELKRVLKTGGTMSGNCAIGSLTNATAPATSIISEMTQEKMGLSMKNRENIGSFLPVGG